MGEQRSAERSRTFLRGRIEFNGGLSTMDCLIRDLSETGAKLMVSEAVTLPQEFQLFIPKTNRSRLSIVRWRRGDAIGIQFEEEGAARPPAAASPDAATASKMDELQAEVLRLRRMLEELRADPSRIHLILDKAV